MPALARSSYMTAAGTSTDSGQISAVPTGCGPRTPPPSGCPTSQQQRSVNRRRALTDHPGWYAQPNDARALVTLERAAKLRAILTQNTDRLHQKGAPAPDIVLELHRTCSSFTAPCSIGLQFSRP